MLTRRSMMVWVTGVLAGGIVAAACSPAAAPQASAQPAASAQEQREARYWRQLTSFLKPVEMKSMTDHRAFMTSDGLVVALHFDNMDLSKAENLNWVAVGVPGKFTKADQQRVEQQFGKGFTHFHNMKNDTHGGQPGAEGVWFVHMGVRDFESPMSGGKVAAGIDTKFMPTPPPPKPTPAVVVTERPVSGHHDGVRPRVRRSALPAVGIVPASGEGMGVVGHAKRVRPGTRN